MIQCSIYIPKYYMEYNYYSPLFIVFLIGFIFTFLSFIILVIFLFIDCGDSDNCKILFKGLSISNNIFIFLYIFKSILNSIRFFIEIKFINTFTVFHIIILTIFKVLIFNIIKIISDYNPYELIIIIVTTSFEIFGIFVFIEIIELNFCGLNLNLKMNIMNRAKSEINLLIGEKNESDISWDIETSEQDKSNDDSNSVYS